MNSKAKNNNVAIILMLFLMYLILAMGDNFKGIFAPFFREEFIVNNTQLAYVSTVALFAFGIFQFVGGFIIEKIGYKKTILFGFIVALISMLVLGFSVNFPMLIVGMFLLNIGMAMFNISVKTLGQVLTVTSTAVLMNTMDGVYGAGNTVLQIISGNLLALGIPWRNFFLFMMGATAVLLVYVIIVKIPYTPVVAQESGDKKKIFKQPLLYVYCIAAGGYLAAEYGVGNWFINYMSQSFGFTSDQSAFYVAIFWALKTVGLFLGGFIADKMGHFRTILFYGVAASILSAAGIIMGQSGLILFCISGFFFSAIFPTLLATLGRGFRTNLSFVNGIVLMVGTLIAMGISMSIGVLNDNLGANVGLLMIPVALIIVTVCSVIIKKFLADIEKIQGL